MRNRYLMKKFFCVIVVLTILMSCIPVIHAAEIVASGSCGYDAQRMRRTDDATYTLYSDGRFVINGVGAVSPTTVSGDIQDKIISVQINEGITSIFSVFDYCKNLKSCSLPQSIRDINSAFSGCSSLKTINIPSGTENIKYAFRWCSSLTELTIPESVTNIDGAFSECSKLESVNIPKGITSIEYDTFSGCKSLAEIIIPSDVTYIGNIAFAGCSSLKTINLPKNLTTIGWGAFAGCSGISKIEVPSSVKEIGSGAFVGCTNLRDITLSDNIESLVNTFIGCTSLKSISIPSKVTDITGAFSDCSSLESIYIPAGVENLECVGWCEAGAGYYLFDYAQTFSGCESLKGINVSANNSNYCSVNGVLFSKDKKKLINYPAGKKDTEYNISDGVETLAQSAFYGCNNLERVNMPTSLKSIALGAFAYCSNIEFMEVPSGVTCIDGLSLYGCTGLKKISIPKTVVEIGFPLGCAMPITEEFEYILSDIYYEGSENDWNKIIIAFPIDEKLSQYNTTIHYNSNIIPKDTISKEDYPVIILPGIMGSRLKGTQIPQMTKSIAPVPQNKLEFVTTVFGAADTGVNRLEAILNDGGVKVYECPYDWRQSIDDIANIYLKPTIDRALQETGKDKVILLAHSMGGLVARAYIQSGEYDYDVDSLIMMGTPNEGSTNIVSMAYYGIPDNGTYKLVLTENFNLMMDIAFKNASTAQVKSFVKNKMTGAYQLLPDYDNYLYYKAGYFTTSYDYGRNTYLSGLNTSPMISQRYESYSTGNNNNKVNTLLLYTDSKDTERAIKTTSDQKSLVLNDEYNQTGFVGSVFDRDDTYCISTYINGDGTVPSFSAKGETNNIYNYWETKKLSGGAHSKMMGNTNMQKAVVSALLQRINFKSKQFSFAADDHLTVSADTKSAFTSVTAVGAESAELYIDNKIYGDISEEGFSTQAAANGSYAVNLKKSSDSDYVKLLAEIYDGEISDSIAISFLSDEYTVVFNIADGKIETKPLLVDNLRSVNDGGNTKILWDAADEAKSYKVYMRNYSEDNYTYLTETNDTEYQSSVEFQDGFSEDCIVFCVIPVFDDYEGGYNAYAYNFENAVADFDYEIDKGNNAMVHFTDKSRGEINSWEWDFDDDGTIDSTEQNPDYEFTDGKHTVTLTVSGDSGSDTIEIHNLIKTGNYIERIEISAEKNVLSVDESIDLLVNGITTDGDVIPLTEDISYWVSNEDVLSIEDGVLKGITAGNASVSVQYDDLTTSYEFAVTDKECAVYTTNMEGDTLITEVYNMTESSMRASVVLAFYDYDSSLVSTQIKNIVLAPGGNTIEFDDSSAANTHITKLYVWGNMVNLKPLAIPYEY